MGEKVTVRVTRDHIAHAIRQTSTQCAVAIAIKDAGDFVRPRVTKNQISFTDAQSGIRYTFDTPEKIRELVRRFDAIGPQTAKPATFTIDFSDAVRAVPIQRKQPSKLLEMAKRRRERMARGGRTTVYTSYREIDSTDV